MTNRLPDWSAPYCELPEDIFYKKVSPSPLVNPCWVDINHALANEVNGPIDSTDQKILRAFSGGEPLRSGGRLRRYTVGTSSDSGLVSLETTRALSWRIGRLRVAPQGRWPDPILALGRRAFRVT